MRYTVNEHFRFGLSLSCSTQAFKAKGHLDSPFAWGGRRDQDETIIGQNETEHESHRPVKEMTTFKMLPHVVPKTQGHLRHVKVRHHMVCIVSKCFETNSHSDSTFSYFNNIIVNLTCCFCTMDVCKCSQGCFFSSFQMSFFKVCRCTYIIDYSDYVAGQIIIPIIYE